MQTSQPWKLLISGTVGLCLGLSSCGVMPSSAEAPLTPEPESTTSPTPESSPDRGQQLPIEAEVVLGEQTIQLEVASTPQQQAIGLMYRSELADDRGMLFPFNPPRPVSFWMKNVEISLDMVFVTGGQIIAIAHNVPPCIAEPCPTYGPGRQVVQSVIELRGGRAEELGLEIGDPVAIQWRGGTEEPRE